MTFRHCIMKKILIQYCIITNISESAILYLKILCQMEEAICRLKTQLR